MSGPRGHLVGNCQTSDTSTTSLSSTSTTSSTLVPVSEDFLFLEPSQLLSLPSFSHYPCPSLAQFPVDLQIDQTGLVVDDHGRTKLVVSGGMHQEWWLWGDGYWWKTANATTER